jgi:hypothetical protein
MIRSMYRGAQSPDSVSLDTLTAVQRGTSLRPERTAIAQAGLDLGLFAQRMSLAFTLYDERTTDLILPGVASASGVVEAMNAGTITNRGIQAAISAVPLSRGRFEWTTTATVTRNANRVESLGDTTSRVAIGPARWGVSLEARPGHSVGAIVGSRFYRHDITGELVLQDGLPLPAPDSAVLGHTDPKLFGGLSNTFRYRNVELSFLFDGQFGGKLFSATNMWGAYSGTLAETEFRPDTGLLVQGFDLVTGSANTVHVSTEDYYRALGGIAERWVYDASFVKLRELRIGASFRVPAISVFRNSRVEASLIGRNLAMWSKAPNIDPETVFSTSAYQGFDLAQVPRPRSFGFQLTVVP